MPEVKYFLCLPIINSLRFKIVPPCYSYRNGYTIDPCSGRLLWGVWVGIRKQRAEQRQGGNFQCVVSNSL